MLAFGTLNCLHMLFTQTHPTISYPKNHSQTLISHAATLTTPVQVSFMELYNEEVTDLLSFEEARDTTAFNGSSSSSTLADGKARLRLLEDRGGVVVQGLEEMIVRSATEIYQVSGSNNHVRGVCWTWW